IFRQKLEVALREKNAILAKIYNTLPLDAEEIIKQYMAYAERMKPYVADTLAEIHDAIREGKHVLLEGAQATLLDLDHGTYPFVTSSNPVAGGACVGAGIAPRDITRVIGVAKAYLTRVGSGPMPTEVFGADAEQMLERSGRDPRAGIEFGTRTGRLRRLGWFDAVLMRYADRLNGFTELVITKMDVLSGYAELPVCTEYSYGEERFREFPAHQSVFHHCEAVYKRLPGWIGHASPQPIVITTSDARTTSSVSGFGNSFPTSRPISASASITAGLISSAGADPADRTTTRPLAWWSRSAAAICERPAL